MRSLKEAHLFYLQCLHAQTQLLAAPKPSTPSNTCHKVLRPILIRPVASPSPPAPQSRPTRRCRTCNERFHSKPELERHRRQRHLRADRSRHCAACSIQFYTAVSYGRHLQLHADNICLFCNIGFTAAAEVHEHIATQHIIDDSSEHTDGGRFTCVTCANSFKTRRALLRHGRTVHGAIAVSFMCGVCLKVSFRRRSELRSHLTECGAATTTADMRVDDAANAALNFGGLDDDMPVEFLNYSLLGGVDDMDDDCCFDASYMDGMVEEFLDDAFQMPAAATSNTAAVDLLADMMLQATSDGRRDSNAEQSTTSLAGGGGAASKHSYSCPRCEIADGAAAFAFGTPRELHLHLAAEHNEAVLVCNQCGIGFTSMTALSDHRAQHKVENRLANESLTRLFEAKDDIDDIELRFERYPSGADADTVYSCRACARVYKTKANAMRHQCRRDVADDAVQSGDNVSTVEAAIPATTTTTTTLLCSLCDKSFRTLGGLKYHLLTHTSNGAKSFNCVYCSDRFLTGINLAAHLRARHSSAAKPHQCDQCPQSFTTAYQLRRHGAVAHGGRREHVCGVCGKAYTQRSHLRHHEWTHNGVKKFACGRCERGFTSRTSLRKHEEKMHA